MKKETRMRMETDEDGRRKRRRSSFRTEQNRTSFWEEINVRGLNIHQEGREEDTSKLNG